MFSIIDLEGAYHQMPLKESCKDLTTISTPFGLYRYNRLPFGLASAPLLWQKAMDCILVNVQGTMCYLDDILVFGISPKDHSMNLKSCLDCLERAGLKINKKNLNLAKNRSNIVGLEYLLKELRKQKPK